MTTRVRAVTDPPGAELLYRRYDGPEDAWQPLGVTPFESDRFPMGAYRFRVEREGYETAEVARSFISIHRLGEIFNAGYDYLADPSYALDLDLRPVDGAAPEMIAVAGGPTGRCPSPASAP